MVRIIILAAAILAQSPIGAGSDYEYLSQGQSNDRYYYKPNAVQRFGSSVVTWIWVDHMMNNAVAARRSMEKWQLDCDRQQLTVLYAIHYGAKGNILAADPRVDTSPIIPGSVGEDVARIVCERK